MKSKNNIITLLILILIYEIALVIFKLDGLTISKIIFTCFIWISAVMGISEFLKNYTTIKKNIPQFLFKILILLIFWNFIAIIKGFYTIGGIGSLLGNRFNTLALLAPFTIAFAFFPSNLFKMNHFIILLLKIFIPLSFFYLIFNLENSGVVYLIVLKSILLAVTFVITTYHFQLKTNKKFILISTVLLSLISYFLSDRTMIIRIFLLLIALISMTHYIKHNSKWVLNVLFILIFIPGILIQNSITNNKSVITRLMSGVLDEELSTDTRTFLYTEVYTDLKKTNNFIAGKGANGTYFSDYFYETQEDTSNRLSVEVGVLSIMLKSGLIGVILYLLILFSAIYFSFFKSNNYYVIGIGMMLLMYTIILFIENSVGYSLSNIFVWFFIGIALSKEMRSKSNKEIFNLLNFNQKSTYV